MTNETLNLVSGRHYFSDNWPSSCLGSMQLAYFDRGLLEFLKGKGLIQVQIRFLGCKSRSYSLDTSIIPVEAMNDLIFSSLLLQATSRFFSGS